MGATTSMIYSGAVDATVGTVVSGAVSTITSTYEMQEELDVTLYIIQQEVMKIQCAIDAARRRRITDRQLLVWLASLIDAVYLGNYYHRTFKNRTHSQIIAREGTRNLAISPAYHVPKRRRTIKDLIFGDEEIRELNNMLKKLKSIDVGTFMLMVNDQPEWPIRTYLYMDQNRVVNRGKEREQVMNFLMGPSMAGENNVDILPIVGSHGGGKTTLVLHCLYDPKVQAHFSLKLYNNISCFLYWDNKPTSYDFRDMLQGLLAQCSFTNITSDDEHTLIAMLKQSLSSERFFIILDNVLGLDSRVLNFFQDCLRCGKQGSKVIFIFNFDDYNAFKKIVNPREVTPVIVDGFSDDEYMSFFEQHAFGSVDPEEYPELAKIGREIAKELGGSIWGAKIFGELLRDNLNVEFWSYFLQNCLLSSPKYSECEDFFAVFVICQLLPKHLHGTVKCLHLLYRRLDAELAREQISYRELMILGPNHLTRLITENGNNRLEVVISKHAFLNKYSIAVFEFD